MREVKPSIERLPFASGSRTSRPEVPLRTLLAGAAVVLLSAAAYGAPLVALIAV